MEQIGLYEGAWVLGQPSHLFRLGVDPQIPGEVVKRFIRQGCPLPLARDFVRALRSVSPEKDEEGRIGLRIPDQGHLPLVGFHSPGWAECPHTGNPIPISTEYRTGSVPVRDMDGNVWWGILPDAV